MKQSREYTFWFVVCTVCIMRCINLFNSETKFYKENIIFILKWKIYLGTIRFNACIMWRFRKYNIVKYIQKNLILLYENQIIFPNAFGMYWKFKFHLLSPFIWSNCEKQTFMFFQLEQIERIIIRLIKFKNLNEKYS